MTIRPLRDKVLVRRDPSAPASKGGIIIPDTAQEDVFSGTVVAVGDGWSCPEPGCPAHLQMDLSPGDRVIFARYAKHTPHGADGHYLLRYEHVYAVIEEES